MTIENQESTIGEIYKHIGEAELKASSLERMLDQLDRKMNSILQETEKLTHDAETGKPDTSSNDNDK